jgi:hypothetical protein
MLHPGASGGTPQPLLREARSAAVTPSHVGDRKGRRATQQRKHIALLHVCHYACPGSVCGAGTRGCAVCRSSDCCRRCNLSRSASLEVHKSNVKGVRCVGAPVCSAIHAAALGGCSLSRGEHACTGRDVCGGKALLRARSAALPQAGQHPRSALALSTHNTCLPDALLSNHAQSPWRIVCSSALPGTHTAKNTRHGCVQPRRRALTHAPHACMHACATSTRTRSLMHRICGSCCAGRWCSCRLRLSRRMAACMLRMRVRQASETPRRLSYAWWL